MKTGKLGWLGIVRLGLVQAALGSIVVLTTSTLNRIMVVELALPATLPGVLVAIHYFVQISRPRFGYGSDRGHRRTPWIIGGMAVLGLGGVLAALSTAWMSVAPAAGVLLATLSFLLIGLGVGASGTCLLVLLAAGVEPRQRAAAASITWIMMIMGFALTAGIVGANLDPFSFERLVVICTIVAVGALVLTTVAIRGLERRITASAGSQADTPEPGPDTASPGFLAAVRDVLAEPHTRLFSVFVFTSMLAYSAQDLVLEPFAGAVIGLTPGESTQLGGLQHGGVLAGMVLVALLGYLGSRYRQRILETCMVAGCLGSALMLVLLAMAGTVLAPHWPIRPTVFLLGVANGAFAVAAIGSMMALVARGARNRDGMRMGIFGAAQAIAFGIGGIAGTLAVDAVRLITGSVETAYASVFSIQAALFVAAAVLATRVTRGSAAASEAPGMLPDASRPLTLEAGSP